ncbi:MAG: hypothetical protein AABX70_01520 [Nanoarchaeota archaeon]
MKSLDHILDSYSLRKAVAALAIAALPSLVQAGSPHDSYYRGKKADAPAPAVPGAPAYPGTRDNSNTDPNGLAKRVLQVAKSVCADASSAGFDDMYSGSSKGKAVARFGDKIIPVDIYKIEVKLPRTNPSIPDLRGEYIFLQSTDLQYNALILGRGPNLNSATDVAKDEKAGTLYLQAFPGRSFIPIEALKDREKPDIKTVVVAGSKPGKFEKKKIDLNPHPSQETQLLVDGLIYYIDTWGYGNNSAGELDAIGTNGDLAGQKGSLQTKALDIWGLRNFEARYSLMLDNVAADLGGLEVSSDRRIYEASDSATGLPVPVPRVKSP